MINVSCHLDEIQSYLGDGSLGVLVGILLIKLTEVGRLTQKGLYHSLRLNPGLQHEETKQTTRQKNMPSTSSHCSLS